MRHTALQEPRDLTALVVEEYLSLCALLLPCMLPFLSLYPSAISHYDRLAIQVRGSGVSLECVCVMGPKVMWPRVRLIVAGRVLKWEGHQAIMKVEYTKLCSLKRAVQTIERSYCRLKGK